MNKAVFLDRDGVINSDEGHYYIYKKEHFALNQGVGEGLKLLQDDGFLLIVITNQGGIAKGVYTHEDVANVHEKMAQLLKNFGVVLTDIFYCPHHDEVEKCLCRKPGNQNIEKAIAIYNIDRNLSVMIGDHNRDIEAGKKSGLHCYKVKTNDNFLPTSVQIVKDMKKA